MKGTEKQIKAAKEIKAELVAQLGEFAPVENHPAIINIIDTIDSAAWWLAMARDADLKGFDLLNAALTKGSQQ